MKLLLPGVFLLVLGIGNVSVGAMKQNQYQGVLKELAVRAPETQLINASPLRRIQLAKLTATRNYERIKHARSREDFYAIVVLGGKAFISISLLLFFSAAVIRLKRQDTQEAH